MLMSRRRLSGSLFALSAVSAVFFMACSGESSSSDDGDSGGGTGGSQGGSSATGGTSSGGTSSGGTSSGGVGGTGGTPPDGSCDDIVPCGGDPTGTWVVRENCTEVLVEGLFEGTPGCEDVVAAGSGVLEGTFTFDNGVATQDTSLTASVTVFITDACAQGLTELPDVTAVQLCPLLGQLMMDPETTTTCAASNGDCRCDGTQAPTITMETDTYEVVGTQLILGSGDTFDFCQDADGMDLSGSTVDPQSGAAADLMVTLDRQ
jgi:hypothetical protein